LTENLQNSFCLQAHINTFLEVIQDIILANIFLVIKNMGVNSKKFVHNNNKIKQLLLSSAKTEKPYDIKSCKRINSVTI